MFYSSDFQVAKTIQKEREEEAKQHRLIQEAYKAANGRTSLYSYLNQWSDRLKRVFQSDKNESQQLVCC